MKTKKRIFFTFLFFLLYVVVPLERIQAQSESGECDREIATKGNENSLILEPNKTFCITGDLVYSDISWADGATLRVTPGKTLTIQNNMANNTNNISLTIELYGTLIMGNPEFNPNLTLNIYSGGKFQTSGNATFRGNKVTINNEGNFDVKVLNLNGNNSNVLIQNGPKAEFLIRENLNVGSSSTLFFQNQGKLEIRSQFGLSPTSVYSNCGNITTKGFNLQKGKVFNTGVMVIEENLDGEGLIENYGQITLSKIQGSGKTFINHGKVEVTSNNVVDMTIKGPKDPGIYGEFSWKGQVNGLNQLYVYGNQIFKNTEGESSLNGMLSNPSALKPDPQSSIVWGECEGCTVIFTGEGCFDPETGEQEPGPNPDPTNYWIGGDDPEGNDWNKEENWTGKKIPLEGENIEFATITNNSGKPAVNDLYLDHDRIIGDLINDSDKDLWVTTGNSLVINGEVKDNNATGGTIVVKADPENKETNGTLIFKDPAKNKNVTATVEFYNKAYECADCGFYRKSWQYFGIPVKNALFPTEDVPGDETVNQWVEPFNGNKWQSAPYAPDAELQAFKGYEMTNSSTMLPSEVYKFTGILAVGDATVSLTKTSNVNHSGVNLVGNSYTAAIPIATGLSFTTAITDQSVYLFNTGTRDQWKKLNGATTAGLASGQYLNVPIHLAGSGDLPAVIPSMHAFLIQADQATNLQISYDKLVKNELVKDAAGNEIATRSTSQKLPYLMVDVIGEGSVDRVRVFRAKNTTAGFDSGWDGRKWMEEGIAQLYVATPDQDALQVSTVPDFNSIVLGFIPAVDGEYQLDLSWSEELKGGALYLNDLLTGIQKRIAKGGTYVFHAKKGDSVNRFSLSYTENTHSFSEEENLIEVTSTADGQMKVKNESGSSCMLFISTENGTFLQRVEVASRESKTVEDLPAGVYVVRLQNAQVNDVRKVIVKNN